ncbi:M24 family metallopeptidase [Methanosphaera sp. WGK6]|uniref:M24 family metallopeptidase n=1 Tax=Methanosphaera sp. WGK6 TaxID=1561964 RepID=UPI00084CB0AA|nr:M24 family metallopeptidase [Methanosphaera sp. WGK6]OED29823.1 methionine aminopeptidase [Methanosphaera sp. WGK6]
MLDKYREAGKIASKVRNEAAKKATAGMKVVDLVDWIESEIKSTGAGLSFPCNISINQIAAHYTAVPNDDTLLCNGDIVKIDLGAEVDGYISDTAVTVIIEGDNADPYDEDGKPLNMPGRLDDGNPVVTDDELEERYNILDASATALENVISIVKDGVTLNDIGKEVETTMQDMGYNPITNLAGHSLEQYNLHAGLSIPNYPDGNTTQLKEGDHVAIEPFATNGAGIVSDLPQYAIYSYIKSKPQRQPLSNQLLKNIRNNYSQFNFAGRHLLNDKFDERKLNRALRPLISSGCVYPFAVLKDKNDGMVAQTEHTIIVEKEGCEVTTL